MQLNFPSETYCVKNETWEVVSFTDNVSVLFSNKKKHKKKPTKKLKDQNRLSCSSSE